MEVVVVVVVVFASAAGLGRSLTGFPWLWSPLTNHRRGCYAVSAVVVYSRRTLVLVGGRGSTSRNRVAWSFLSSACDVAIGATTVAVRGRSEPHVAAAATARLTVVVPFVAGLYTTTRRPRPTTTATTTMATTTIV